MSDDHSSEVDKDAKDVEDATATEGADLDDSADDSGPLKALLQRSLAKDAPEANPELVRKVQKRIRDRSDGKFFADGWSTGDGRIQYALVASIMLVIVAVAYFVLSPTAFGP